MTRNVTLRMDADILKKCRYAAVEEDMSLSQWIAVHVAGMIKKRDLFDQAKERSLNRLRKGYHLGGKVLSRETLHER
jgi:hypothetical protein